MDTTIYYKKDFDSHPLLAKLLHLFDVPNMLYVRGKLPEVTIEERGLLLPRILTIVGSRDHSRYAEEVISHLLSSLRGHPVIIVSGLALGVDTLAHRKALDNKLLTIAVPGSGLSSKVMYPRENERLADEILYSHGCLISEHPDDTRAAKWTFPSRNRIMAAFSDAVLIIEAREKSGTLITARQALELGKNIGVVPGSIFSDHLKGSHALLRDGATPILDPSDLFDLLSLKQLGDGNEATRDLPLLSGSQKILYDLLGSPLSKSELLEKSKLSTPEFLVALTTLEMLGLVKTSLHEIRRLSL